MQLLTAGCSALLIFALGVNQFLNGGSYFAALGWPGAVAVCAAGILAGFAALRDDRTPDLRLPLVLLLLLLAWMFYRWAAIGAPAWGFLQISNASVGLIAFGCVAFGMRGVNVRMFLVVGILVLGIFQLVEVAMWRIANHGMFEMWFSEQLRIWSEGRIDRRTSGFYINRNHLAWFMAACCLLSLSLCVWARIHPYLKFLAGWLSGFFAFVCLLALSRGGALGLAGGLLMFTLFSTFLVARGRSRLRGVVLLFLAFVLASMTGAIVWMIIGNYEVQERLGMVGADFYREEQWKSPLRQFQLNPLEGTGVGTFADYSRIFRPTRLGAGEAVYAHNDWLQTMAEMGWIGLILLAMALLSCLLAGLEGLDERVRSRRGTEITQSNHVALVCGGMSCVAAFAVHSFFDFNMMLASNSLLGFLMLGLCASGAIPRRSFALSRAGGVLRLLPAVVLVTGAVGFLVWSAPFFSDELSLLRMENARLRGETARALEFAKKVGVTPNSRLQFAAAETWLEAAKLPGYGENSAALENSRRRAAFHASLATSLAPLDRLPTLRLADAKSLLEETGPALGHAMDGIRLDPQFPIGYEFLALVRERGGDPKRALRLYRLAQSTGQAPYAAARIRALVQKKPDK